MGPTAESFMYHGPELSPAFYLYNQGYDVWLGNARGGFYSRRHQTLNPDTDREFWNFGFEELTIDHVANVEQILQETGNERLSVFAFSVGAATFIASASINPEFFEQRVDVLFALAPGMSYIHTPSFAYRFLIDFPQIFNVLRFLRIYEIAETPGLKTGFATFSCDLMPGICLVFDTLLENTDPLLNDQVEGHYFHGQVQRGTSTIVMEQISQIGRSGRFQYFDFGTEGNIQEYGTEEPPVFPLDQIRVPIALMQGKLS
jgi:lysosomal acid lipase/cholesteryl ester hydrolase